MGSHTNARVLAAIALAAALGFASPYVAAAQTAATVSGHLFHSVTTKPIVGATVTHQRCEARDEVSD